MELTPRRRDRLLLFTAALVAERRLACGLRLSYPESVALISAFIIERARDGRTAAALMEDGRHVLHHNRAMEGVPEVILGIQAEATFSDGSKLVTVHNPIVQGTTMIPGKYQIAEGNITLNRGRKIYTIVVGNHDNRLIQVGSYYYLYEVNPVLRFGGLAARDLRLNIAAGTAVRFESGRRREVELVRVAGTQKIVDFRSEAMGALETDNE